MKGTLARARLVGDPPADRLVAALCRAGQLAAANAGLARLVRNDDALPAPLPPALRRFLERSAHLPRWAEPSRLARAQAFADRQAIPIAVALFCASLPSAFGGAKGALVLATTGRMRHDLDRRINETASFVFDVLAPGGFDRPGRAIRSLQRVRLLHAAVRHRLRGRRRAAAGGEVPINQEDLLGTLFAFSLIVLQALRRLGIAITARDAEDYYHLWRVAGQMLGIRRTLLPATLSDAQALATALGARLLRPSPHGQALTQVLMDGIARHLPGESIRASVPQLIEYLVGESLGETLGLSTKAGPVAAAGPALARVLALLASRAPAGAARRLLEGMVYLKLRGQRPSFAMPLPTGSGNDRGRPVVDRPVGRSRAVASDSSR